MGEVQIRTTVDQWDDAEGWGALAATEETPGGVFVHFTAIEMEGFKTLRVGQEVETVVGRPPSGQQDGYRYMASVVRSVG